MVLYGKGASHMGLGLPLVIGCRAARLFVVHCRPWIGLCELPACGFVSTAAAPPGSSSELPRASNFCVAIAPLGRRASRISSRSNETQYGAHCGRKRDELDTAAVSRRRIPGLSIEIYRDHLIRDPEMDSLRVPYEISSATQSQVRPRRS